MARLKRVDEYQKLDQIEVLEEDKTTDSAEYFVVQNVPDVLPAGKSGFLINGSDNLVLDTEVRVEIKDSQGGVIYSEFPQYLEGTARIVSVWVYQDTPPGEATITVIGEKKDVPPEWDKTFNVRWQKKVLVDPLRRNDQPIRFYTQPGISVTEVRQPYLVRNFPTTQTVEYVSGSISGKAGPDDYTLVISGGEFNSRMVDGILTVSMSSGILSPSVAAGTITPTYRTAIKEVVNSGVALAKTPFTFTASAETPKEKLLYDDRVRKWPPLNTYDFGYTNYTISYEDSASYTETQNYRSFAKVTVYDMATFTGDVRSINLYMKSAGTVGDYELVDDVLLDPRELLINSASVRLDDRVGYFYGQGTIDNFWTSSVYGDAAPPVLSYTSSKIIDSMHISGSPTGADEYFSVYPTFSLDDFYSNTEYTFAAKLYAKKGTKQFERSEIDRNKYQEVKEGFIYDRKTAVMKVYLSGSGFQPTSEEADEIQLGKLINTYQLSSQQSEGFVGAVSDNIIADNRGNGKIIFKVEAGEWYISDASLKASIESGFSPDVATFIIPIQDWQRKDTIQFKAEFFDLNKKKAETFATSSEIFVEGGNLYVGGDDNLLTGSWYIGNFLNAGMEFGGGKGTDVGAFLSSHGYLGYVSASAGTGPAGFLMWSGSVLRSFTSEYDDVGFELHGGSGSAINPDTGIGQTHALRYRSDTGRLEITGSIYATDGFFSGTVEVNEILVPVGDNVPGGYDPDNPGSPTGYRAAITQNGYAFFMSGSVGGWQIGSWSLSSPDGNFVLYGSSSAANSVMSSSLFFVDDRGGITASNALLENFIYAGALIYQYVSVNTAAAPNYWYYVTGSTDGGTGNEKIYALLDLRSDVGPLGGSTAQFVRIDQRPTASDGDYVPIAGILYPRFGLGGKSYYGGRVVIEDATSDLYLTAGYKDLGAIAANHPELTAYYQATLRGCLFNFDSDDWYAKLLSQNQIIGVTTPTTYSRTALANFGGRYDWARGFFDWKLQTATAWDQVQISVLSASEAFIGNLYGATTSSEVIVISSSVHYDNVVSGSPWSIPFFNGMQKMSVATENAFIFVTGSTHDNDELFVSGSASLGFLRVAGDTIVTDYLVVSQSASIQHFEVADKVSSDLTPSADDTYTLGESSYRWSDLFATQTTVGASFERNLATKGIGELQTGTVLVWRNGRLIPCDKPEDKSVIGIVKHGKDEPIVLGAEPVLVTGDISEGDFIVTSTKKGHGKSVKTTYLGIVPKPLTGKIIAQALESGSGDSHTIRCMIQKL